MSRHIQSALESAYRDFHRSPDNAGAARLLRTAMMAEDTDDITDDTFFDMLSVIYKYLNGEKTP